MPSINTDIPPEFIKGVEVVCIRSSSKYFAQRGTIYGSGFNEKKGKNYVYVQWHTDSQRLSYLAKNLVLAPKAEHLYRTGSSVLKNGKRTEHRIPAEAKPRPSIFELAKAAVNASK